MPDRPLVTIAIACFNAQDTIGRAIVSAQRLNWTPLEIVVVDDASSDASVVIVDGFRADDPRIRFIRHAENLGTGATRTTLIREALGEYVAFLDDDDVTYPDRIAVQIEALHAAELVTGNHLVACYGSRMIVRPDGHRKYSQAIAHDGMPVTGEQVALSILVGDPLVGGKMGRHGSCTLLARRATFEKVGDFDSQFRRHQDTDWAIRLALAGGSFVGTKAVVIDQYLTMSSDKSSELVLGLAKALRFKHRDFLERYHAFRAAMVTTEADHYDKNGPKWRFRWAVLRLFLLRPRSVWSAWIKAKRKALRRRFARQG